MQQQWKQQKVKLLVGVVLQKFVNTLEVHGSMWKYMEIHGSLAAWKNFFDTIAT